MGTNLGEEIIVSLSAVDATPLDGSSANRTYSPADKTQANIVPLSTDSDGVVITMEGTGANGDSAVFNLWAYTKNGYAHRAYHTVTATLGTAVGAAGRTWAEVFVGTDTHIKTIGINDSLAAGNSIAKIEFDRGPYEFLMFEPITFNTLTAIHFHLVEYGLI